VERRIIGQQLAHLHAQGSLSVWIVRLAGHVGGRFLRRRPVLNPRRQARPDLLSHVPPVVPQLCRPRGTDALACSDQQWQERCEDLDQLTSQRCYGIHNNPILNPPR